MIAVAGQNTNSSAKHWQAKFVELLPAIRSQARYAFRAEPPEQREELIAEVVANCWVAFVRLMQRGLEDVIYATPLAQYAIKQLRRGLSGLGEARWIRPVKGRGWAIEGNTPCD